MKLIKKLFFLNYWRFNIFKVDDLATKLYLDGYLEVPSNFIYAADPFKLGELILFEGLTFDRPIGKIYRYFKGQISEIIFDSFYSNLHMSFPFIFDYKGDRFLLPQISNLNKLSIFRFDASSNHAFHYMDLLNGADCRDSIVLDINNKFIVITTVKLSNGDTSLRAILYDNNFSFLKYLNVPKECENFRCAGYPIYYKSSILIPIQNSVPRYGSGVNLYSFSYEDESESVIFNFDRNIVLNSEKCKLNGFHTYNFSDFEATIDFRFSKFYFWAFLVKLKIYFYQLPFSRIACKNVFKLLFLFCFNFYFKLPKWHLRSLLIYPRYYSTLRYLVNLYNINSIIDIGAGLGELSKLKKFDNYIGVDIDINLVRASRLLNTNIHSSLSNINFINFDAVLLINFLHNLNPDEITELVKPLSSVRFIIVDEIHRDALEYFFHHNFCELFSDIYTLLGRYHVAFDKRDLLVFKKSQLQTHVV